MHPIRNRAHLRRLMLITNDAGGDDGGGSGGNAGGTDDKNLDDPGADDNDDGDGGDGGDEDALGDKGKQALQRMKDKLRTEKAARLAAERERDEAKGLSDADKVKREAEATALTKANDRIKRSEIKAAAKGVLADPADAFKFLDLDKFEVDDDGNVDEDEIASALEDLVKTKPYLAAQGGRRFQGDAGGGSRKDARPKQLTEADVKRLNPDQVVEARKKGQLNDLLGITR
mgnify:CR=1 FL=1